MTQTQLPAVVTIQDLPTGTTLTGTELLEAVQTSGGVANSIQVTVNQIMTTSLGALPIGGGTGQILESLGTGLLTQWANISSLVTASTGLASSGSTTVALSVAAGGINTSQLSSSIFANPTGQVSTAAVNGIASTIMRSDAAPAINQAMAPTWTAVHNFNALATAVIMNSGGLQINAATGTTNGIVVTQNASGIAPNPAVMNAFNIVSDVMDASASGNVADGVSILHQFGGATMKGARQALQVQAIQIASTSVSNTNRDYVGLEVSAISSSGDGGGSGTEKGSMFAINPSVQLQTAATHMVAAVGGEVDVSCGTGSSTLLKYGWSIVQLSTDKVQGSSNDAAISCANQVGAVGWKVLWQVGDGTNAAPLATTGSIMTIVGSATIANGIDLSNGTFTGSVYKGPGLYSVDPSGNLATGGNVVNNGVSRLAANTPTTTGGATGVGLLMSSTTNLGIFWGSGLPTLVAATGSLYFRTDGSSATTRLYSNLNGSTSWTSFVATG